MDGVMGTLLALALAAGTPVVTFLVNGTLNYYRKKRAWKRFKSDPLIAVGKKYVGVYTRDRAEPIIGECKITALEVERVEVTSTDGRRAIGWTCQEAESLIFVSKL